MKEYVYAENLEITEIIEKNKLVGEKYKNVFKAKSENGTPKICIIWGEYNLNTGDIVDLKGRYDIKAFVAHSLTVRARGGGVEDGIFSRLPRTRLDACPRKDEKISRKDGGCCKDSVMTENTYKTQREFNSNFSSGIYKCSACGHLTTDKYICSNCGCQANTLFGNYNVNIEDKNETIFEPVELKESGKCFCESGE